VRALFFAEFPPPFTGMTIATETIADLIGGDVEVVRMNTSYGRMRPDEMSVEWVKYYISFAGQLAGAYTSLWSQLQQSSFDVFYFVASPSALGHWRDRVALEIARPHVRRAVAHVHNGNFPDLFEQTGTSRSAQQMVEAVDTFVFLNQTLSDQLQSYIPSSKRRVVHNTIDEKVRCTDAEVETKITEHRQPPLRVLYLSNMIETKGYRDLAEAVERFNTAGNGKAIVDFIGDWPSSGARSRFMEEVSQYTHADSMRVHGRVTDRTRIRKIMLEADVFVLPTYYPNEAQPLSIIEAFNAATPVIATRHASIPEYLFDNENGYLVDPKSPSQIESGLRALSDRSNWRKKARAARRTHKEMFSPAAVRDAMLDALQGSA